MPPQTHLTQPNVILLIIWYASEPEGTAISGTIGHYQKLTPMSYRAESCHPPGPEAHPDICWETIILQDQW